jgi:NTP pyrophosphatase (non-canonical NTP hydrolase)
MKEIAEDIEKEKKTYDELESTLLKVLFYFLFFLTFLTFFF